MKSISIVSKHIIHIIGISSAYHSKKKEFLNSFVSLTPKHIIHIIFTRVCKPNYTAFFKDKKIIVCALANMNPLEQARRELNRRDLETGVDS